MPHQKATQDKEEHNSDLAKPMSKLNGEKADYGRMRYKYNQCSEPPQPCKQRQCLRLLLLKGRAVHKMCLATTAVRFIFLSRPGGGFPDSAG